MNAQILEKSLLLDMFVSLCNRIKCEWRSEVENLTRLLGRSQVLGFIFTDPMGDFYDGYGSKE